MIVDCSALVAIALAEPERDSLLRKIDEATRVMVGAPTLVEAGIVLASRLDRDSRPLLAELVTAMDAVVVDFGVRHWEEAVSAWWRFGKSRHAAALNFGDCLAYAAARVADEPLLALGDDFARTDLSLA